MCVFLKMWLETKPAEADRAAVLGAGRGARIGQRRPSYSATTNIPGLRVAPCHNGLFLAHRCGSGELCTTAILDVLPQLSQQRKRGRCHPQLSYAFTACFRSGLTGQRMSCGHVQPRGER